MNTIPKIPNLKVTIEGPVTNLFKFDSYVWRGILYIQVIVGRRWAFLSWPRGGWPKLEIGRYRTAL